MSPGSLGNIGESIACFMLKKKNYRILEQNFNSSIGEIDIIASIGKTLVFIEVKTRTSEDFGSPSESINTNKVLRIRKAASFYLAKNETSGFLDHRFDIIGIMAKKNKIKVILEKIDHEGTSASDISEIVSELIECCSIEHIESAF